VVEGSPAHLRRVAAAGIPVVAFGRMKAGHIPWSAVEGIMRDEFRVSQSYYAPAEQNAAWRDQLAVHVSEETAGVVRQPGVWHSQDLLLVPLIESGGDVVGFLSVGQPQNGRVPDQTTVEALEIFAAQAALAVQNSRLVEELERRADTLALFNEVSHSATAKLELDEVLSVIVEMAPRLLNYDHSTIFLLDGESGRYVPRAVHGFALESVSTLGFAPGEGIVGAVVESGMPLAIDDMSQQTDLVLGPLVEQMGSIVLSPLTGSSGEGPR